MCFHFQNPKHDLVVRSGWWQCLPVVYFCTRLLPSGFFFFFENMKDFIIKVAEEKLGWSIFL